MAPTATTNGTGGRAGSTDRIDPDVMKIAAVLIVGALAVVFDTTIVTVALHALATDLHASVATIQWVSTGFLLALGIAIPLAGWAQGRFGGKRVWMFALVVFLIGSVACSLAWNAPSLIAFRAVQGFGGGLMLPLLSTLIVQASGGQGLGRIMSVVSLPTSLGPILGPVIGGLILGALEWRWLFWVNVPFCVVGFLLAWRMLPADTPTARPKLDVLGLMLLSPGFVGVLYGLSNAGRAGGFARADVLVWLIVGVTLVAAFAIHAVRRGDRALVDIRLLAHRPVWSASALLFLSGASLYGAMLLLPLYWQEVRGFGALAAGLLLAPQGLGALVSRSIAGRLTDSLGAKWVAVGGFALIGLSTVPFALATEATNQWWLVGVLVVRGFGLGAVLVPLMTVAFVGLDRSDVPNASIITRIVQQVGGSFGVALLAVILQSAVTQLGPTNTLAAGFDQAFWWAVGFTAVAVAVAFALPSTQSPRRRASRQPAPLLQGAGHVGGDHDGAADPLVAGQVLPEDQQAGQRGEDGVHAHEHPEETLRNEPQSGQVHRVGDR